MQQPIQEQPALGFWRGVRDMLPLSVAVIQWGILAGSAAVNAGLSTLQAAGMSVLVFAGAAQLVSLSMVMAGASIFSIVMAGASIFSIVMTIFFLTSQHFVYALSLRSAAAEWPLMKKRLCLGFLLTDELYATAMLKSERPFAYLLGAGFSFYLCWVGFSMAGIGLAHAVPDLSALHLEFSIVAVFLVMAIMLIQNWAAAAGVMASSAAILLFSWLQLEAGILLAGLCGMLLSALIDQGAEQ